jgi:hypothetical protein
MYAGPPVKRWTATLLTSHDLPIEMQMTDHALEQIAFRTASFFERIDVVKAGPHRKQITRKLGLSNFAVWVFFMPHSRFIKRHETKTYIHQHFGSSVRVPIDRDVRSASTELGLY